MILYSIGKALTSIFSRPQKKLWKINDSHSSKSRFFDTKSNHLTRFSPPMAHISPGWVRTWHHTIKSRPVWKSASYFPYSGRGSLPLPWIRPPQYLISHRNYNGCARIGKEFPAPEPEPPDQSDWSSLRLCCRLSEQHPDREFQISLRSHARIG